MGLALHPEASMGLALHPEASMGLALHPEGSKGKMETREKPNQLQASGAI
jgi:hypothetical protein